MCFLERVQTQIIVRLLGHCETPEAAWLLDWGIFLSESPEKSPILSQTSKELLLQEVWCEICDPRKVRGCGGRRTCLVGARWGRAPEHQCGVRGRVSFDALDELPYLPTPWSLWHVIYLTRRRWLLEILIYFARVDSL